MTDHQAIQKKDGQTTVPKGTATEASTQRHTFEKDQNGTLIVVGREQQDCSLAGGRSAKWGLCCRRQFSRLFFVLF